MKIIDKIKQWFNKINLKKENIIPFSIILLIVAAVFFGVNFLGMGPILFGIVFSILLLITWSMAGLAVFRSLIVASVSLSVLIFLSQTYCNLPLDKHTADESLKFLFSFGLFYSGAIFFGSLYKELKGDKERGTKGSLKTLEEIYNGKKPLLILLPYGLFIGLFLWQLAQVMDPIIHSLCIY
jgi:hypothetical protein